MNDLWTERINSGVRSLVTLIFAGARVWAFLIPKIVSTDAFIGIAGMVIAWWFRARDEDKRDAKDTAAVAAAATAATVEAARSGGARP
jgi:hypothetical protein